MSSVLTVWPHYEIKQTINSMADIRNTFPDGKANELNWCFLSTSGVHGSYRTLDDIKSENPEDRDEDGTQMREITVVIVQPRLVVMRYGNVMVESDDDDRFLRGLVASSIEAVAKSQKGNL